MKTLYRSYNKDSITDGVILDDIRQLSKGKLNMDLGYIERNNLFESNVKPQQDNQSQSQRSNQSQQNRGGDNRPRKNVRTSSSNQRNK